MVSQRSGQDLRETAPLPRKYPVQAGMTSGQPLVMADTCRKAVPEREGGPEAGEEPGVGSDREKWIRLISTVHPSPVTRSYRAERVRQVNLSYPADGRETRRAFRSLENRHLNHPVESNHMNAGGCPETDVPSSRGEKPGQRRSRHSSRRLGKPVTGRRAAVRRDFGAN
jgi:hypothetical protein